MKNLKNCVGKNLQWEGLRSTLEKPDELFCDEDLVAKIIWKPEYLLSSKKPITEALKKSSKFEAEGQTKEGKWIFERQGFLLNRRLIAKKSGKAVASCSYFQTNQKIEIKLLNKKIFTIKQGNILHPRYVLEGGGKELVSVQVNLSKLFTKKEAVRMTINPAAKSLKELSFLVLFFMYYLAILTWDTRFV